MKTSLLLLLILLPVCLHAQQRYILFYSDKGKEAASFHDNPELVISRLALRQRQLAGIPFNYADIPVSPAYIAKLNANGIRVIRSLRWLNASLVETLLEPSRIMSILPQVVKITPAGEAVPTVEEKAAEAATCHSQPATGAPEGLKVTGSLNYGLNAYTCHLLEVNYLHDLGFTGKGVTVAFLDAGYALLDTNRYFDSVRLNDRVLATYDFWDGDTLVYHKSAHGTFCTSELVANKPGSYIGVAPDVNLLLAITDDLITETPQDEFNYAAGLEWADSLGAQIVSASISYKNFNSAFTGYTYEDMDGNTAITTIACDIAASKGLLIVNSAGNSGKLCAPCDADSILCVGGAKPDLSYDGRSSTGPSFDNRIKPNVAGFSTGVPVVSVTGDAVLPVSGYNGTSGATPYIAGIAACLKQAHPAATNMQLKTAIEQSAHKYANPDSMVGHGVPNARRADSLLRIAIGVRASRNEHPDFRMYPNPAGPVLVIEGAAGIADIQVVSTPGTVVRQQKGHGCSLVTMDMADIAPGIYFVKITGRGGEGTLLKLLKR